MASVEQKGLAEDVKSVHRKLREQLLGGGEPNEVTLISVTGTLYFAFYEGLGETYARSGDFRQVQQKHEIFGNFLLGKERRGKQGGLGQESGIIQVSLSPVQIFQVSFRSRAIFGLMVKREKRKETRKG